MDYFTGSALIVQLARNRTDHLMREPETGFNDAKADVVRLVAAS